MNKRTSILALAVVAGLLPAVARADTLDQKLFDEMPTILKKLEAKGYKAGSNIGVLRFRVQRGSAKPSFRPPLGGSLANSLENLLIMRNPGTDSRPAGIIHNATGIAMTVPTWFAKPETRKKLFELEYPLAWGKPPAMVKPSVFLTGILKTSPDVRKSTLIVQCFDAKSTDLVDLATITFKSDLSLARELGYSFAIPSKARKIMVARRSAKDADQADLAFEDLPKQDQQDRKDDKKQDPKKQADPDKKQDDKKQADPDKKQDPKKDADPDKKQDDVKQDKKSPLRGQPQDTSKTPDSTGGVRLQMLVDGKPVKILPASAGDPVAWQVTSPAEGQKIAFRLRNNSSQQLGVVLKINGASTFNQELAQPEKCQKWVIESGKSNLIDGFWMLGGAGEKGKKINVLPFKVATGEEAKAKREAFGEKAGLIEVDVYQKGSDGGGDEDEKPILSAKGLPPSKERKMRESYVSLRDAMIKSAGLKRAMVNKREILIPDESASRTDEVEEVPFKNPILVAHIAIRVMPAGGGATSEEDVQVED